MSDDVCLVIHVLICSFSQPIDLQLDNGHALRIVCCWCIDIILVCTLQHYVIIYRRMTEMKLGLNLYPTQPGRQAFWKWNTFVYYYCKWCYSRR